LCEELCEELCAELCAVLVGTLSHCPVTTSLHPFVCLGWRRGSANLG